MDRDFKNEDDRSFKNVVLITLEKNILLIIDVILYLIIFKQVLMSYQSKIRHCNL